MSAITVDNDGCVGTAGLQVPGPFDPTATYQWSISKEPLGASATLSGTTGEFNLLTVPVAGCYSVKVVVTRVQDGVISCDDMEVTVCVSACEPECEEGFITGSGKECPPDTQPPNKAKPVPLTQQFLTGAKRAFTAQTCENPLNDCDCDDKEICCDPNLPSICWNNMCACPGAVVTGAGILNTSANDACCGTGRPWIFDSVANMNVQGPQPQLISCAIVWGHNILQGTAETFPPIYKEDPNEPAVQEISLCYDDACIGGFTRPIVMNLVATETDNVSMQIGGSTVDGGPIRIDNIFFGQKLFFEDDFLPGNFTNPHNGSDFFTRTKKNDCGNVISREVVRQEKTLSIDLECLSDNWLKTKWRSYMRYLGSGQPVYFQWSRNGCPDDIFMGDMTAANQGSTYNGAFQSLNFTAEGFCSQPQSKRFA